MRYFTKANVERIKHDTTMLKIGLVAFLNYLELEPETESAKKIKERGRSSIFATWKSNIVMRAIMGNGVVAESYVDDTLTAMPIRDGSPVNLKSDIERIVVEKAGEINEG